MIKKHLSELITASGFFIIIALSLILFNRDPGRVSFAENRNLALFPEVNGANDVLSEGFAGELASWFEDNLGLRDMYLTISGILNYNLLHRAKTEKVELGKDGFLFLADEGNLEMDVSPEVFMEKIPQYAKDQQAISDKLKSMGIEYVFMLTPGKPSVYPEYIESSDHAAGETIGDALYDHLKENTDVKAVWSKEAIVSKKDNEEGELLYLKTDTHWTTYGRNIAYRQLIEALNDWGMTETSPAEVKFFKSEDPYVGDLSGMMGPVTWGGARLSEESFTDWEIVSPKAKPVEGGDTYESFKNLMYEKNVYNPELCAMYHNDSVPEKKVLICGDSMIGICLLPQLAECFSDLTFVWSYSLDEDIIEFVKPDILISQFGERQLPLRLDDSRTFLEKDGR